MKKENRLSDRTRSPEPDDLSSQTPRLPSSHRADDERRSGEHRRASSPNPDESSPHVPPHDDE